jgi:hypothetical protein
MEEIGEIVESRTCKRKNLEEIFKYVSRISRYILGKDVLIF